MKRCGQVMPSAQLANDIFVDRISKVYWSISSRLKWCGCDYLYSGIGENSATIRKLVIEGISWFGCDIDPEKNVYGQYGKYLNTRSKVRVLVILDEELVIARDVERFKKNNRGKALAPPFS